MGSFNRAFFSTLSMVEQLTIKRFAKSVTVSFVYDISAISLVCDMALIRFFMDIYYRSVLNYCK
ncbi:hypothetical protein A9G22_02265 [Gilliamella sp. App2-1]|uniref:hypothetical protein n=2 Tax=unclassified Gilliamella TaxID=2685620 RepID=UPI000827ED8B|nr:hypothetical protein [Gilliamella apicola]OCG25663.1 hypothetical protein A9G22_02265 [Gilliamella apicola]